MLREHWRQSMIRRWLAWYGSAWRQRPAAHTGAIVLITLAIWAAGQGWQTARWHQRWAALLFGGWAVWALFQTDRWESIKAGSRALRWWHSERHG